MSVDSCGRSQFFLPINDGLKRKGKEATFGTEDSTRQCHMDLLGTLK